MKKEAKLAVANLLGYFIEYDKIEDYARLCGCTCNVTKLVVIEEIDEIDDWAFSYNMNLEEIHLNYTLRKIGHCAFLNCKNLKRLSFKDETGKMTYFDDFNKFYNEFNGIIEPGAFENCFGNSILVNIDSKNEKKTHLEFEKALSPSPFYENQDEEIFVKILSDDNDGRLHFSLINYQMIVYDLQYFDRENQNNKNAYYRPYFYEFLTESKEKKDNDVFKYLGMWMIGKLINSKNINSYEHSFTGEVLFSASPFRFENMQLVILDRLAPAIVAEKIKQIYELSHANRVNLENKTHVLEPIIKEVVYGANADTIKVYNVGQAMCNYIYLNNLRRVMFDVGYSYRKEDYKDIYINKNKFVFENCKPHLIILSHWDLDHILGVAYSKESMFKVNWIAPSMEKLPSSQYSISAARLAKYLAWKNILYLIDEELNGKNIFCLDSFQIWKGEGKQNTSRLNKSGNIISVNGVKIKGLNKANNIGLIIKLKTNNNSILLPGDCEYQMIPKEIYSHSVRYENMIIPHHGSNMALIRCRRIPKIKGRKDNAIISSGYNTYTPRHPWEVHAKFLNRLKYNIYKTSCDCKNGYLIKIDLENNNIL